MNAREQKLLFATVVMVGGAALVTQVLEPAFARQAALSEQREVLEQALERERALASRRKTMEARRAEMLKGLTPPKDTSLVPWVMESVRTAAAQCGFKPASLRFVAARPLEEAAAANTRARTKAKQAKGPFIEVRLEMRARVSFRDLQEFLCRLAASERHVRVRSLDVTPRTGGDPVDAHLELIALAPADAYRGVEQEVGK
ncbi:MAG: hypothetical protein AB7N76_07530 [Planctomycetota bacterium]